ncbi:hypothetical protein PN466_20595 [Roseofilum reptotaenium CS-1145]|uniref:ORC1/DEAH AAA+ ATPase domain-containing protein n=1 Tax=Roseofilum reptotaenium AO1-A TaxID=1925591 RepID=A0A1L9QWU2_9CYAN|nr:AAA family ATPase [Roseofilum reptotaenium]MDB9519348.1 hypothetical protein [Roseofilum reptotaenium CS-1145]OJJ27161.1 hypothetical protein BI308_01330 [Roseofilum reptotaenium AO1-A]
MTITWEEFIKEISGKRGLSPDQEKTLLARLPSEDQCLAEEIVANELNITLKTVKKRMSKVHKKFKDVLDDYDCFISSSLKKTIVLHDFLKKEYRQRCSSVIPDRSTIPYSDEFEGLIQEKIKDFCGREFVFQEFDRFIQDNPEGYFTVVGNQGMGKTALAAKLVSERQYPHYFNILNDNRNTPESFRKSMTKDLIERYKLIDAWGYDLQGLLEEKVRQKLHPGEKLILVIDALDEVNQELGNNLLSLPMRLPKQVYIFLTRGPYNRKTKRLNIDPSVPYFELDLREEEYMQLSERDIKAYIHLWLQDPQYQEGLQHWIEERNLTTEDFVVQIAEKSENNFMYLHYLLPALANGQYKDLQLAQLPNGLEDYYQTHWVWMGMESEVKQLMAIILFILKEVGTPISSEMIAEIAEQDRAEVDRVLSCWMEYLKMAHLDGECCYRIDRASFLNFLQKKTALKQNRQLFQDVNRRIIDYLEEGTMIQMTIAEKLAAKSPSFQRVYLGRLPYRYAQTEQWEKYRQLLTNFEFIEAKINHPEFGVQALIEDYDLIDAEAEKAKVLKLVQGALRMSAHVLQEDRSQLVGQLLGRMLGFKHPEIQQLLAQANQSQTPGLRPLTPSLKPPGGALVCILEGHSDSVNAVALTPDGQRAISGSNDKTLKVWNLKTRELEQTLTGHQGSVRAVAVTPDGERAISGSDDETLKVWNLKMGELEQTLTGHQGWVSAVVVTLDGERAISGSGCTIKVWVRFVQPKRKGIKKTKT